MRNKSNRQLNCNTYHCLKVLLLTIVLIYGCEDTQELKPEDIIEIGSLTVEPDSIEIENTATIISTVVYSGNVRMIGYNWTTTGGRIIGDSASVTFVAPKNPGNYTITLKVTDGMITATKTVLVNVTLGPTVVLE
ncbi:PKD domain-containing protein [Candidatus Poribacteria bacterium]|nr:PKD domain-containing protein [Candidatus Poribacteria bacterium]